MRMCIYLSRPRNLLLACRLSRETGEGKKRNTKSTTAVAMTSSHESICLANCLLLRVSVHCSLVFVQSVQEADVCGYILCHDWCSSALVYSLFCLNIALDSTN